MLLSWSLGFVATTLSRTAPILLSAANSISVTKYRLRHGVGKFNASVYPPSFAFTPRTPQKHLADSLPQCSHNETWSPVPGSLYIPALAVKRRGKADNRGLLSQIEWQMDLAMAQ